MAKKKKSKSTKKGSGKMEPLIVSSKAKAYLKAKGFNTSSDAFNGLNGWVYWLLEQAAERAHQNNRKTVRTHDFLSM